MSKALVSVLIPVYNSSKFLDEAVKSIICQTYANIEIIITDDGSTDDSLDVIRRYKDNRIKLITHEKNQGLIFTRNEAVAMAQGEYIAFLDSDDISSPDRIEKQLKFLEENTDFGMTGSWVQMIDEKGNRLNDSLKFPAKPEEIPVILLFKNYFTTSSIMVRKSCLPDQPFDPDFPIAEDYNLWVKIAEKHKVWNLPEVLTYYRVHEENIHKVFRQKMQDMDVLQLSKQLSKLDTDFSEQEKQFFYLIGKIDNTEEYELFLKTDFAFGDSCLRKLLKANDSAQRYNNEILYGYIFKLWLQLFVSIEKYNILLYHKIKYSVFFRKISFINRLKFFLKCMIHFNSAKRLKLS